MPTIERVSGFPKSKDNASGDVVVTDRVMSRDSTSLGHFRTALNSAYPIGATSADVPTAFLVERTPERMGDAPGWYVADLTYQTQGAGVGNPSGYRADGEEEYSMEDGGLERPLETASGYRTKWNYALACATAGATTPTFWATATDIVIAAADATAYRWIRDPNELPVDDRTGQKWQILNAKTKPGVETWISPAPVVNWKKYFYGTANARSFVAAHTVGNRETPAETFGLPGTFLVMSVNVTPDGRYWTGVVKFQSNRSGWDIDLYPT